MASGTPVVAASEPALREEIADGAAGRTRRTATSAPRPGVRSTSATGSPPPGSRRARLFTLAGGGAAGYTVEVYRKVTRVKVSAFVVSHGNAT